MIFNGYKTSVAADVKHKCFTTGANFTDTLPSIPQMLFSSAILSCSLTLKLPQPGTRFWDFLKPVMSLRRKADLVNCLFPFAGQSIVTSHCESGCSSQMECYTASCNTQWTYSSLQSETIGNTSLYRQDWTGWCRTVSRGPRPWRRLAWQCSSSRTWRISMKLERCWAGECGSEQFMCRYVISASDLCAGWTWITPLWCRCPCAQVDVHRWPV